MPFKDIPRKKLRAKIIRKGIFTQLAYLEIKLEREQRLFRTVLDYALYDLTGKLANKRKEVLYWFNLNNEDFQIVCYLAGLSAIRVHAMFLFFLRNYFLDIYEEYTCFHSKKNVILESQSHKSSMRETSLNRATAQ